MEVKTSRFGSDETVEVSEERIFEFYPGLGGFEHHHRYALITEPDSPLEWLQSVEEAAVGFALMEPFLFYPDYGFELLDGDAEALGLDAPEDALVRCLLTVREEAAETTANLLAPIIINERTRLGRQIVLQDSTFPLRYPVFEALQLPLSA